MVRPTSQVELWSRRTHGSWIAAALAVVAAGLTPTHARAQDGGKPQTTATDAGSRSAADAGTNAAPKAAPKQPQRDEIIDQMKAFPDSTDADPTLPAGSLVVEVRDASDAPRPGAAVMLGIVENSVAKGENRDHKTAVTDALGRVQWNQLRTESAMAYRVSITESGASFAATPFRLPEDKGIRVVLHTYPVVHDNSSQFVVMQAIVYVDLKDDRIQVQQQINLFNFGRVAWAPESLVMALPSGFTALRGGQQMSDQGIEPVEGRGARLKGTYGPGKHAVEYGWQLPYGGESTAAIDVAMPPNVAAARVMVVASSDMKVSVDGFPAPKPGRDGQGNTIMQTEREMTREEPPLRDIHIKMSDIPGPGPLRYAVTGIAGLAVAFGFVLSRKERTQVAKKGARKEERARLLAELEELEKARRSGEIGPQTYEAGRRELIDALARTFATEKTA